jgi:DNA-binding NarL/FixJ family response regulator
MAAIAVHLLGYLFLLRRGLFRTHTRAKVFIASLILVAAFASQIRYSVRFLVEQSLELFDFSLLVVVALLIFHPKRRRLPQKKDEPLFLTLDPVRFTAQDVAILKKVLNNEKYQSIASEYGMGISAFKKRVGSLYAKLEVQDRMDFMASYADYTLTLKGTQAVSPESVLRE